MTYNADQLWANRENCHDWYSKLDLLGISFYTGTERPNPTPSEIAADLKEAVERTAAVSRKLGIPLFFAECGARSVVDGTRLPWAYTNSGDYDGAAQANYLAGVIEAFSSCDWWRGLMWWKWMSSRSGRITHSPAGTPDSRSTANRRRKCSGSGVPNHETCDDASGKAGSQVDAGASGGRGIRRHEAASDLSGLPPPWEFDSLRETARRFEEQGFRLCALEGDEFDMSRIKLGLPERDEDIEHYRMLLRNMGRLGIGLLCYNFMAGVGWFRTRFDRPERGGALTSEFNRAELPPEPEAPVVTHEQMWRNYEYFLRAVIPVAEEAGVKLGLHPDDPPFRSCAATAGSSRRPTHTGARSPLWRVRAMA